MDILMVIAALLIILVPLVSRAIKAIPEQPVPMSNKKRKELEKWYDKSFNEILDLRLRRFEKEEEREAFRKEKTEEYMRNKFKNQFIAKYGDEAAGIDTYIKKKMEDFYCKTHHVS